MAGTLYRHAHPFGASASRASSSTRER
jgi:hypothetical protein